MNFHLTGNFVESAAVDGEHKIRASPIHELEIIRVTGLKPKKKKKNLFNPQKNDSFTPRGTSNLPLKAKQDKKQPRKKEDTLINARFAVARTQSS